MLETKYYASKGEVMGKQQSSLDSLFNNKGELKRKITVSPFFLRPAYQYTIAEIKDTDQQELHKND